MDSGTWILVLSVAVAVLFGTFRLATDGRFRGTHRVRGVTPPASPASPASPVAAISVLEDTPWGADLGERFTLLQFSSAFCAPCRATRRVLSEVAELVPGVRHLDVDAEQHLDVVRRLGILRTPTTLVLDAGGVEVTRATGAPTKLQVLAALGAG